ncbi:MAG: site-specific integrase [Phycisphaerales bacterium]
MTPETLEHAVHLWIREAAQRITEREARESRTTVLVAAEACGWESAGDITRDSIVTWIAEMLDAGKTGKRCNNLLSRVRKFCQWLVDTNRLPQNPAASIPAARHFPVSGVRSFTEHEMQRIIQAVYDRKRTGDRRYTCGRAHAYVLAGTTGLRKSELFGLRWGMFLPATRSLELPGWLTKAKRTERLPLEDEAFETLSHMRSKAADVAPSASVFGLGPVDNRTLFDDMAHAGVPRVDEQGRPAAWHSFRKGYLTLRARLGDGEAQLKARARHSSGGLAMRVYVDAAQSLGRLEVLPRLRPFVQFVDSRLTTPSGLDDTDGVTHLTPIKLDRAARPAVGVADPDASQHSSVAPAAGRVRPGDEATQATAQNRVNRHQRVRIPLGSFRRLAPNRTEQSEGAQVLARVRFAATASGRCRFGPVARA